MAAVGVRRAKPSAKRRQCYNEDEIRRKRREIADYPLERAAGRDSAGVGRGMVAG